MTPRLKEQYRATVAAELKEQLERQKQEHKVNQLVEKLSNAVEFEVPDEILTAETQGQAATDSGDHQLHRLRPALSDVCV